MKVNVEKLEGNKAKLEFIVEKEKFIEAIDTVYAKNVKQFAVPGFRKGKVPKAIVMKTYGEEAFYNDAFEIVANEVYPNAIKENNLDVVSRPEVDVKKMSTKDDLEFTATVDLKPEVELGKYKGIELTEAKYDVTKKDIEERLNEMAKENARIITVEDKPLANGNISTIDFEGFLNGVPFEGGKAENHELEIGSGSFIPGFEEQLIGMKIGEEKEIKVTFPEDYHSDELKGKETTFKVKLNGIKEKEMPKIDDEFAKDVSEFETLDELKKDIEDKMIKANEDKAHHELEDAVIAKVTEDAKMEIPKSMIEFEIDNKLEDIKQNMQYQGIAFEQYLQMVGQKIDDVRVSLEEPALKDIKTRLTLEAIMNAEKIEVSDEELDAKFEELAKRYDKKFEDYKKGITQSMKDYYRENMRYEKTIHFILDNAKIK